VKLEMEDRLRRLEIEVGARGAHFCMFLRDGCLAVAPCEGETFGAIGSTGLAVEQGLGYLVYRDGRPVLAGRDFERPAEPAQVEKVLRFSADLKAALE
jgi:hypothetical protein